jgi:hypothetical protein
MPAPEAAAEAAPEAAPEAAAEAAPEAAAEAAAEAAPEATAEAAAGEAVAIVAIVMARSGRIASRSGVAAVHLGNARLTGGSAGSG